MFAILITDENMPKILQEQHLPDVHKVNLDLYCRNHADWYIVTGYVSRRGEVEPWAILPAYLLNWNFEYDPIKIKTDWDQIVRK